VLCTYLRAEKMVKWFEKLRLVFIVERSLISLHHFIFGSYFLNKSFDSYFLNKSYN